MTIRAPSPGDLFKVALNPGDDGRPDAFSLVPSNWDDGGRIYGAVEPYSGHPSVDYWPAILDVGGEDRPPGFGRLGFFPDQEELYWLYYGQLTLDRVGGATKRLRRLPAAERLPQAVLVD